MRRVGSWRKSYLDVLHPTPLTHTASTLSLNPKAPLPQDPGILHGVLPSGLSYYVRLAPEPPRQAVVRLVLRLGSVVEEDTEAGFGRLLERLALRGTRNFGADELSAFGAVACPDPDCPGLIAEGGLEDTLFELTVSTRRGGRFVEQALFLLADVAANSRVTAITSAGATATASVGTAAAAIRATWWRWCWPLWSSNQSRGVWDVLGTHMTP